MGILRKIGGSLFNFKVHEWMGSRAIQKQANDIYAIGKGLFTIQKPKNTEDFAAACQRLNLDEQELQTRYIRFTKISKMYVCLAIIIFIYNIYMLIKFNNWMGLIAGSSITMLCISYAFRYSFWAFQIKHKKLGCSIKEWLTNKT